MILGHLYIIESNTNLDSMSWGDLTMTLRSMNLPKLRSNVT
jgi:hypothetical protein